MILESIKPDFEDSIISGDGVGIVPLMTTLEINLADSCGRSYLQILCHTVPYVHALEIWVVVGIKRPAWNVELVRELGRLSFVS